MENICGNEFRTNGGKLVCSLEKGHSGNHQEIGNAKNIVHVPMLGGGTIGRETVYKYTIQWDDSVNKISPSPQLPQKNIFSKIIKKIGIK